MRRWILLAPLAMILCSPFANSREILAVDGKNVVITATPEVFIGKRYDLFDSAGKKRGQMKVMQRLDEASYTGLVYTGEAEPGMRIKLKQRMRSYYQGVPMDKQAFLELKNSWKDPHWGLTFMYSIPSTIEYEGSVSGVSFEASVTTDSPLGVGAYYLSLPEVGTGYFITGDFETLRDVSEVETTVLGSTTTSDSDQSFTTLTLSGNLAFAVAKKASIHFGLNYPAYIDDGEGDVSYSGALGYQLGVIIAFHKKMLGIVEYRTFNATGSGNGTEIDSATASALQGRLGFNF